MNMNIKCSILFGTTLLVASVCSYGQPASSSPSQGDMGVTMAQYQHMCSMQLQPNSPVSLLAWKDQLGLNEAQTTQIQAIQDKAIRDAEAVLNDDQRSKLNSFAAGWKSQTLMQCMRGMMDRQMPMMMCPMMQPAPAK